MENKREGLDVTMVDEVEPGVSCFEDIRVAFDDYSTAACMKCGFSSKMEMVAGHKVFVCDFCGESFEDFFKVTLD